MLSDLINTSKLTAVADIIGNNNVQIRRNRAIDFWGSHYLYLINDLLPKFEVVDGPSNPRPDPNPVYRLQLQEQVLLGMLDTIIGDPEPQPSLGDPEPQPMLKILLRDNEIRYAALKNLQQRLDSAQQRIDQEMNRLQGNI